jgi:hypothetical protein
LPFLDYENSHLLFSLKNFAVNMNEVSCVKVADEGERKKRKLKEIAEKISLLKIDN